MSKLIIAGSRIFTDYELLESEVKKFILETVKPKKLTIISGTANGADKLGEQFAEKYGFDVERFPAKWDDLSCPQVWIRYDKN